jgi:prepilin-type N-terminal cleavage/methylation domain-containing protein
MHISVNRLTERRQRGDTLVEVLIAIAVVSMILGGAYVTTNRSLYATRSAQERGNALKLAESQLEQLKGLVASDPSSIFGGSAPNPFCISASGAVVADTDPDCAVDTSGAATTVEPIFHISMARAGNTFTLTENWVDVGGRHTDKLEFKYRVYE